MALLWPWKLISSSILVDGSAMFGCIDVSSSVVEIRKKDMTDAFSCD